MGTGFSGLIQRSAELLNLPNPNLTFAQKRLAQSRRIVNFASISGIAIGCILGMFPCLFLKPSQYQKEQQLNNISNNNIKLT